MAGHLITGYLRETTGWEVESWGRDEFPVAGDSLHFSLGSLGQIDLVVE